ncbi:glycoside hydrolase family 43 protein [Bifidobacterium parmae]|uniref:Beta-xylosidase n=1 Tax=Bifidobacterium parmae TaxID=361854 RepID=A0A2N5J0B5_9BIFI|nr:glycoside hydrolase family 43 protein [Bifidobacterium parmae]PLS27645.1 beta-xylosidase [Bifidobacterium parmae]
MTAHASTSAPATLTGRTYANPVPYADGRAHTAPDPFVIRYRSLYYCYATDEHGVLVSTSPDLTVWTSRGYCYTEPGRKNYWAPSVILLNGVFHMYFSNMPEDETDPHTEIMRVATSDDPLGPFVKQAELFDTFAIDSQVVMGDDARLYLLYADNQARGLSDVRPGTSVMVDRLVTPFRRAGEPKPLITPTMDEEIFARNRFGDGRDWHTVEGATYFTYRDKAFITYSANAYEHEDYFVGYSVASLPAAPADRRIDALDWRKQLNAGRFDPLLIRSDRVEGTGHNSLVKAPNGVDDWLVYHGRNADDELYVGTEQRVMRIDPLYHAEGLLDTDGPTSSRRVAPLAADAAADFAHGVPDDWTVIGGEARAVDDAGLPALETDAAANFAALAPIDSATQTVGAWVKGGTAPFGSRYGLIVRCGGVRDLTGVRIDAGARGIVVIDMADGIARTRTFPLPADVDPGAWHELVAVRAYERLGILLDGRYVGETTISPDPGRAGIVATATRARFAAFTVTDHVDLWGKAMADVDREIEAKDPARLADGELAAWGVRPATFVVRPGLTGRRFVLDFAFRTDRAETLIGIDGYRVTLGTRRVELLRDGVPIAASPEPVRLRETGDDVCHDGEGRALRTIRIAAANGLLRVHTRGRGWTLPFDGVVDDRIRITLSGSALAGYARTSLGPIVGADATQATTK